MSQIIDCVLVSTEPFTEQGRQDRSPAECFTFCSEVYVYAERLVEFGFEENEIPKPLIHVHRVTDFVTRSEPLDDLEHFLVEIKWSRAVVEETIDALDAVGADAHSRFLATVHNYLSGLGYKIKNRALIRKAIAAAAEEHLSSDALMKRYGNFGMSEASDMDRKWTSVCVHAVQYMDNWTNIKRVPRGPYNDDELKSYVDSRLELARRLAAERGNPLPNFVLANDTKAFVMAALNGDVEMVRTKLASGADVNARTQAGSASLESGATPLMVAAARGNAEIVALLIGAKARVNIRRTKYGETALILAAQEGHLGIVRDLLNAKANVNAKAMAGYTALMAASHSLHLEIVQTLIAAGADVNAKTTDGNVALTSACSPERNQLISGAPESRYAGLARLLLAAGADANVPDSEGWTPLICASRAGLSEVVKDLLAAGAEVNARTDFGFTALMMALSFGRAEIARLLLAAKADVHAATESGDTALIYASGSGYLDVAQSLLDAGADVNARGNHDSSALIQAAAGGHLEIVQILLAANADVNAGIKFGRTALSFASMYGHLEVVKALVAANADIHVKDAEEATALMLASQKGHTEVERFLQSLHGQSGAGVVN